MTELNLNDVPNTLKEMFDPVLDSFVNRLPSDAVKIKVPDHVLKGLKFKYQELLKTNRAYVLDLQDTLKAPNTDLIKVIDSGKISELKETHKDNKDLEKMSADKGYRRYVGNILQNGKVIAKLKEWNYAGTGNK